MTDEQAKLDPVELGKLFNDTFPKEWNDWENNNPLLFEAVK